MSQITNKYSDRVLIGNWFDRKLAHIYKIDNEHPIFDRPISSSHAVHNQLHLHEDFKLCHSKSITPPELDKEIILGEDFKDKKSVTPLSTYQSTYNDPKLFNKKVPNTSDLIHQIVHFKI